MKLGKTVNGSRYVHRDAVPLLSAGEAAAVARATTLHGGPWNVAKIAGDRVSLLEYEDFDEHAFPALLASAAIDTATGEVKLTRYADRANPPILHRKELLLPPGDPRIATFGAVTRMAEDRGLFADTKTIGTRLAWQAKLAAAGLSVRGGALEEADDGTPAVSVAREKTAIVRPGLSTPVSAMINFGMISSATTVFDYGCGLGQDVEILTENGYRAFGWDPNHRPDAERREADVVNLGFVVNVIEDRRERDATLRDAWSYARRGMTVSAMLSAKADVSGQRPHGDGYLTKRSTFQRYYTQPELLDWVGSTLGETPVSLGPGIVSVFKDKDFEQEVNFRRRSRARTLAGLLDLPARSARRQPPPRRTRERDIEAEIEALWQLSLSLGRAPAADEVPTALAARIAGAGASLRAATRAMLDARETKTLDAVAEARKEDLLVHGALSIFPGAPKYASLPLSLQRDIRHFYGSASALKALSTDELAALRRAEHIEEAIWKAEAEGLASRENGIVRLSMRNETRLPVPLRIMLGCADVVFPGFSQMDAVEIGPKHANLRGFLCRDFDAAIPRVAEVVSVDLAAARFRRDAPRDRVLYLKALFLSNDDPSRAKQEAIDRRLVEAGLVDAEGRGPSGKELGSILAAAIRVDG